MMEEIGFYLQADDNKMRKLQGRKITLQNYRPSRSVVTKKLYAHTSVNYSLLLWNYLPGPGWGPFRLPEKK